MASGGTGAAGRRRRACDFVTEYIAPGAGQERRRGAGTRMMARVVVEMGREGDEWAHRGVHGHVWGQNEGGRGFWAAVGMRVAMGEDGGESATEVEGTVEGRAYEVGGTAGQWGYMRGRWGVVCERVAARLGSSAEAPELVSYMYENLEDMKMDKAVYKAVAAAIRKEHGRLGGDGATMAEIMGETAEQRRVGRIRYVVVAEAPCAEAEGEARPGPPGTRTGARARARASRGGCLNTPGKRVARRGTGTSGASGAECVGGSGAGSDGRRMGGDGASESDGGGHSGAGRSEGGGPAAARGKRGAAHLGGEREGAGEGRCELDVSMTPMGESEAGAVWLRSGVRGGAGGAKAWRAGRRRTWHRLADVNVERRCRSESDVDGMQSKRKRAKHTECSLANDAENGSWSMGSRVGAVGTASGSACGSVGSGVAGAVDMERTIEEAHKGRGHYAVGSRWHEPVLRAMMTKLGSPSLEWRYGDG